MVFKMLCFYKLSEINAFTLSTILLCIKPVQQYCRLKLVTMEMEKLCSLKSQPCYEMIFC